MKIQVIVGSTREGRQTQKLAKWVANEAKIQEGVEIELVDLADYELPFFDEAISPQYNPKRDLAAPVKQWLDKLSEADGYIMVTPEYNRSTSGVLKNAIDFIDFQLQRKPVALVAHGSSGGAQAVGHLRGIIPGVLAVTVPQAVYFTGRVGDAISDGGELNADIKANPYGPQGALKNLLSNLIWYTEALSRAQQ